MLREASAIEPHFEGPVAVPAVYTQRQPVTLSCFAVISNGLVAIVLVLCGVPARC